MRKEFAQEIAWKIISREIPEAISSDRSGISGYLDGELFATQVLPEMEALVQLIMQTWEQHFPQEDPPAVLQPFDNHRDTPSPIFPGEVVTPAQASTVTESEGIQGDPGKLPTQPIQITEAAKMQPKSEPLEPQDLAGTSNPTPTPTPTPTQQQAEVKSDMDSEPIAPPINVNPMPKPALKVWTEPVIFQLPNASIGQVYEAPIEPVKPVPGLEVKLTKAAENFGLGFDKETCRLKGFPTKDGTFDIEVTFTVQGYQGEMTSRFKLIVNPDPKSLWKNIPSDPSGLYAKPDEDSHFINGTDGFTLVAGSKRGRSHAQKGMYRDDDFFIQSRKDGWQIAIVSDGAGSAKYSRRGSQIICKHGGQFLDTALDQGAATTLDEVVTKWHEASLKGIDEVALLNLRNGLYTTLGYAAYDAMKAIHAEVEFKQDIGAVAKDFSSTALLALVKRFPFGVFCGAFAVGDGAIGIYMADGKPLLMSEPDGGEFSGQTRFLANDTVSGEELAKRLRYELISESDFRGFHLMTDGISDPFFQTDKGMTMPERWTDLISQVEAGTELSKRQPDTADRLVEWLDFWSKGEHDDRTLAIIY